MTTIETINTVTIKNLTNIKEIYKLIESLMIIGTDKIFIAITKIKLMNKS